MTFCWMPLFFFFFQAEAGIRGVAVTGVQTCALPISIVPALAEEAALQWDVVGLPVGRERANLAGGAGYTMSTRSKHKIGRASCRERVLLSVGVALHKRNHVILMIRDPAMCGTRPVAT